MHVLILPRNLLHTSLAGQYLLNCRKCYQKVSNYPSVNFNRLLCGMNRYQKNGPGNVMFIDSNKQTNKQINNQSINQPINQIAHSFVLYIPH